jgi:hypothetical protein
MSQRPPPVLVDFTGRLLQYEIGRAGAAASLSDGFQRICGAMHERLAPLISSNGFSTLFARALKLAARDCPVLAAVTISVERDVAVSHLPLPCNTDQSHELAAALALVLAHFIWLLVNFIGGNLGLGAVCEIWPEVPFDTDFDSRIER